MKTTKKDFELYCDECEKWIGIFGLNDWKIEYEHGIKEEGNAAQVRFNAGSRLAIFSLCLDWDVSYEKSTERIERCAFHEVCHLLVADFERYVAPINEIDWDRELHRFCRKMENVVWANTEE
jgi:hypothetical protein